MAHGFGDAATHIDRQGSDFRGGLLVGRFFLGSDSLRRKV